MRKDPFAMYDNIVTSSRDEGMDIFGWVIMLPTTVPITTNLKYIKQSQMVAFVYCFYFLKKYCKCVFLQAFIGSFSN